MIKVFIAGAGHGGMLHDKYVTAPKKMYTFPDGEVAQEGILMRQVIGFVEEKAYALSLPFYNITATQLDIDIDLRVDIVNAFGVEYGNQNVLYMPHHANAGKGEGFEIYTSPGDTPADPFAKLYAEIFKKRFPDIKFRHGYTDGKMEADKEKPFYELRMTRPPTILPEWNFFDVRESWDYMNDRRNQHLYADMICEFMSEVLNLNM